jgi:hypothetical protein
LTRNERRLKDSALAKLKSIREWLLRELETRVGFQIIQDHSTNHSETTTYRGIGVASIAGDSRNCDDFTLFQLSNNKFKDMNF